MFFFNLQQIDKPLKNETVNYFESSSRNNNDIQGKRYTRFRFLHE